MENLPKDPMMLMSFINMKLRDEYPSLDELCASLSVDRATSKPPSPQPASSTTPPKTNSGNRNQQQPIAYQAHKNITHNGEKTIPA